MNAERPEPPQCRLQEAIEELKGLVLRHYPSATFGVCAAPDEPGSIELLTYVDIEDTEDVLDVVIGRLLDMQDEEGLPLHVLPVRLSNTH